MRKKFLAISISLLAGINLPVQASNEVTVESGGTGENNATIEAEKQFDYVKYSKVIPLGYNLNRSLYAMAALVQDTGTYAQAGYLAAANNAFLTNNGIINLHYKDIVAAYASQIDIAGNTTLKYDNIMGWGMLAGENSTLINNGTINFFYDEEDSSATYGLFSHPMYVYENSTMINNGTVNVTGPGSAGAQVRGLTTEHSYVMNINNGTIYIDVEKSFMSRALATTGNYGSLINNGTIFNRTNSVAYGMSAPSLGTFANTGIINTRIQNNGNASAGAIAAGMMVFNTTSPGTITLDNTGVINVSSDIPASAENSYLPRASEVAVHSMLQAGKAPPVFSNFEIRNYATTLRDFGATRDLIHARWANIDFSKTNLILRPSSNYSAGTSYEVSADTLVTKIEEAAYPNATVNVSGIDSMTYSAEMSDFISTDVRKVSDGVYRVALVPVHSNKTKKLTSAAAMTSIDFTRVNLDQINHELERNDRLGQKWFIAPYYSRFKRNEGLSGHSHGYIVGSDWQIGRKSFGGLHAAYALGSADGGDYSADSSLKSFLCGLHYTIYPQENKNWIRTQATFFHNSGDAKFTMPTATSTLTGKSSNKSNGFYLAVNAGMRNQLSDKNELRSEIGLSYLKMTDAPKIHWSLLGETISGYDMKFDKYNTFYATAKTSLIHNFTDGDDDNSLLFSLGVRGRLSGKKLNLNMMDTNFGDPVREDSVQGLVELAYRRQINNLFVDVGYQGIFGSKSKNHLFHAGLKMNF